MDEKRTLGQRLYRLLFRFYGPAQALPPPYASEEERRQFAAQARPRPPGGHEIPPGYRIASYTDERGIHHHSLVPDTATPAEPSPEGGPTSARDAAPPE